MPESSCVCFGAYRLDPVQAGRINPAKIDERTVNHFTFYNPRLRIVVVRVLVFSLFATLFARLYYLQVVSGDAYHAAAASQKAVVPPLPSAIS